MKEQLAKAIAESEAVAKLKKFGDIWIDEQGRLIVDVTTGKAGYRNWCDAVVALHELGIDDVEFV